MLKNKYVLYKIYDLIIIRLWIYGCKWVLIELISLEHRIHKEKDKIKIKE